MAALAASRAEDTASKLKNDQERWTNHLRNIRPHDAAPRAAATSQSLTLDVALRPPHGSVLPLLGQVLPILGCRHSARAAKIELLSVPHIGMTRGTEVLIVRVPSGTGGSDASLRADSVEESHKVGDAFILKIGAKEQILREAERTLWAAKALGPTRVPRSLLTAPEVQEEVAMIASELVRFASSSTLGRLSSLHDYLHLGTARFALEDVRRAWQEASADLEVPEPELEVPAPDATAIQWIAKQAAEVIVSLARLPLNAPPEPIMDHILFGLVPLLEHHLLQRVPSTSSPLHETVRGLTEAELRTFDVTLRGVLRSADGLRSRLRDLKSAADRGSPALPRLSIPLVWMHGRLTAPHLLLREQLELCVASWSRLEPGPLYADLSMLLTSIAFETVRVPIMCGHLESLYKATAEAGPVLPRQKLSHHLRVTESTASRLLEILAREGRAQHDVGETRTPEREVEQRMRDLLAVFQEATAPTDREAPPKHDLFYLLAWVRSHQAAANEAMSEAKKISEALCDWTPPRRAVRSVAGARSTVPRMKPPPHSRRSPGEVPVRGMQWGWQVLREFREACAALVPPVEGPLEEVWPLMWHVPSLRLVLSLLDAPTCPWPQKVWLLYHASLLAERVSSWLEGLRGREAAVLEVRVARDQAGERQ